MPHEASWRLAGGLDSWGTEKTLDGGPDFILVPSLSRSVCVHQSTLEKVQD